MNIDRFPRIVSTLKRTTTKGLMQFHRGRNRPRISIEVFFNIRDPCIGSTTDDRSTLVTPTLLNPSETSGNLGETWPKQRQQNFNKSQVYSLRDNSGHDDRKETMSPTSGPTPNSSRYTCLTSSMNST